MKVLKIEEVYQADKDLKKEHILSLMDWNSKQGHLPRFNELEITRFLYSCYYNNELAKITIENNATMRTYMPEIYKNRCYEDVAKSFDVTLICVLPQLSPDGYHMNLSCLLDKDPSRFILKDSIKKLDLLAAAFRASKPFSHGEVIIFDCSGAAMGHVLRLDLVLAKKYLLFIQDALPIRLKAIHLINCNAIIEKILSMVRPFIRKELFDMIKMHTKLEHFYKYVPQELLPKEYGGQAPSVKELNDNMRRLIEDYSEYLRYEETLTVDESKRADKTKRVDDVFGTEGTFKKLDID